ncbi:MAG: hypothetical protein WAV41_03145 [Microgenomates group bacterium]
MKDTLLKAELAAGECIIRARSGEDLTNEKMDIIARQYDVGNKLGLVQDIFDLEVMRRIPGLPKGRYYFEGLRKKQ